MQTSEQAISLLCWRETRRRRRTRRNDAEKYGWQLIRQYVYHHNAGVHIGGCCLGIKKKKKRKKKVHLPPLSEFKWRFLGGRRGELMWSARLLLETINT